MKRLSMVVGIAITLTLAWSIGRMQGQAEGEKVIFVSAKDAKFSVNPSGATGGSMAPIWGDASTGAHGTFTKLVPGFDAGMNTHTNDVWLVVIKGAYLYKDEAGVKRVGPGDFIRVHGGQKHWSGGGMKEGA